MALGMLFWVLLIVAIVFFGWGYYRDRASFAPTSLVFWILIFILGWATFGSPIK